MDFAWDAATFDRTDEWTNFVYNTPEGKNWDASATGLNATHITFWAKATHPATYRMITRNGSTLNNNAAQDFVITQANVWQAFTVALPSSRDNIHMLGFRVRADANNKPNFVFLERNGTINSDTYFVASHSIWISDVYFVPNENSGWKN